ncbi:MAG: glycosyltransferase [Clostridium lundense]|nr:glycosyltransferase [Clostridium lundense]
MKVLFCMRSDYYRNLGEDSMQALKIKKYLKKIGVEVDINYGQIEDYSSYDIVHLFNLKIMGETYKHYKIARYYKKNIVITPLYWDQNQYYNYINDLEGIKLWDRSKIYRQKILKGCKMVFPSSLMEEEFIKGEFGKSTPCNIIHGGVEVPGDEIPLYNFKGRYNLDNYVLSAGRISKKNNQIALAEACDKLGMKLVLTGSVRDKEYLNKIMTFKNVLYLGGMDEYDRYNAYKFAKLYVNSSFAEIVPIYSLEAAVSGCNMLCTHQGSSIEYFSDMIDYCSPYDLDSIVQGLQIGVKKKKDKKLRNHIIENYNWQKVAKDLYESYLKIK